MSHFPRHRAYVRTQSSNAFYATNSLPQRHAIERFAAIVSQARWNIPRPPRNNEYCVADYGCGDGANSNVLTNAVARRLVANDPLDGVTVVRCDANEESISSRLAGRESLKYDTLQTEKFVCGDFYRTLLPPSSVHVGVSANALHWLSSAQSVNCQRALASLTDEGIRKHAQNDLQSFLRCRGDEIACGGKLLITIPILKSDIWTQLNRPLFFFKMAIQELQKTRVLSRDATCYSLCPIYLRRKEEVEYALSQATWGSSVPFRIDWMDEFSLTCPLYHQHLRVRKTSSYAASYCAFIRAFSEKSVMHAIACFRGEHYPGRDRAVETFYKTLFQLVLRNCGLEDVRRSYLYLQLTRT